MYPTLVESKGRPHCPSSARMQEVSSDPILPSFCSSPSATPLPCLCLQVGVTASGGEISCVTQTLPVKCELLKAHRSCSGTAVFPLAQHYPSAHTDTSSVWLLQIMENRNMHLPGTSLTRQFLLSLPLLYPPAVHTASNMRRQSMWEDNMKANACSGLLLRSCHLWSGMDTLVPKSPHCHRTGFAQSWDFL